MAIVNEYQLVQKIMTEVVCIQPSELGWVVVLPASEGLTKGRFGEIRKTLAKRKMVRQHSFDRSVDPETLPMVPKRIPFTWAEAVEVARRKGYHDGEWMMPKGRDFSGLYFPVGTPAPPKDLVPKFAWKGVGVPCEVTVNRGDDRVSIFQVCGELAVDNGKCGRHASLDRRNAERDAAWAAEWQRKEAEREAEKESTKVTREALDRLRPLLEELGIRPGTLAIGKVTREEPGEVEPGSVGLWLPPEAMEMLVELASFTANN